MTCVYSTQIWQQLQLQDVWCIIYTASKLRHAPADVKLHFDNLFAILFHLCKKKLICKPDTSLTKVLSLLSNVETETKRIKTLHQPKMQLCFRDHSMPVPAFAR